MCYRCSLFLPDAAMVPGIGHQSQDQVVHSRDGKGFNVGTLFHPDCSHRGLPNISLLCILKLWTLFVYTYTRKGFMCATWCSPTGYVNGVYCPLWFIWYNWLLMWIANQWQNNVKLRDVTNKTGELDHRSKSFMDSMSIAMKNSAEVWASLARLPMHLQMSFQGSPRSSSRSGHWVQSCLRCFFARCWWIVSSLSNSAPCVASPAKQGSANMDDLVWSRRWKRP